MKNFTSLAMGLAMMAVTVSASAEGIHVGYCEGVYNPAGIGKTGNGASVSAAMLVTPEMLAPYASCEITSMAVALAESTTYPETITGWLRSDKEGDNLYSATVAAAEGWLTLTFDAPIKVSDFAEAGVWAGFDYVQPKKLNILAIGGEKNIPNSCWTAKNGAWQDYKSYGVLPLELIVEGEGLPQYDLTLKTASAPSVVKLGTEMTVKGTVKNNALQACANPVVTVSLDGNNTVSETLPVTLQYRDEADFAILLPLSADDMEARDAEVNVEVSWSDGTVDDFVGDNSQQVPVSLVKDVFFRKMVVEEGTGAWCGWCIRGIVGLRTMNEKYPDQFIGLGVHNGDSYVVSSYNSWITSSSGGKISGFPSCLINRDGKKIYDPSPSELENAMLAMNPIADLGISLKASYNEETNMLIVNSTVTPMFTSDDADLRIVYVVVEDQLPISQANYYSGGGSGEMGGYENEPNPVNTIIDDVVRGVYPDPKGAAESLPTSVVKGTEYTHTAEFALPNVSEPDNVSVVAFVIDNKQGGQILNGEKTHKIEGYNAPVALEEIKASAANSAIYNLNGQRVDAAKAGLNIVNGQVVFIAK